VPHRLISIFLFPCRLHAENGVGKENARDCLVSVWVCVGVGVWEGGWVWVLVCVCGVCVCMCVCVCEGEGCM